MILALKLVLVLNTQGVNVEGRARGRPRRFHARAAVSNVLSRFLSRSSKLCAESPLAVNLFTVATVNVVKQLDQLGVIESQTIAAAAFDNTGSAGAFHFQDMNGLQSPDGPRNRLWAADTRIPHQSSVTDCGDPGVWVTESVQNWEYGALRRREFCPQAGTYQRFKFRTAHAHSIGLRPRRVLANRPASSRGGNWEAFANPGHRRRKIKIQNSHYEVDH